MNPCYDLHSIIITSTVSMGSLFSFYQLWHMVNLTIEEFKLFENMVLLLRLPLPLLWVMMLTFLCGIRKVILIITSPLGCKELLVATFGYIDRPLVFMSKIFRKGLFSFRLRSGIL